MATSGGASSGGNGRDTAVTVAQITAVSTILVAIISCIGGLIATFINNPPASPTATSISSTATLPLPTQAPILPTEALPVSENIIFTISQCVSAPNLLVEVNVYIDGILIGRLSNVTQVHTLTAFVFTEGYHAYYLEIAHGYYNTATGYNDTIATFTMEGEEYFTQGDNLIVCHSAPNTYPGVYIE